MEITIISSEEKPTSVDAAAQDSHQQPVWHVLVLSFLTFSIYLVYWSYRAWRDLKRENADAERVAAHPALAAFKDVSPQLRTLGLLFPIVLGLVPLINPLLKTIVSNGIELYILGSLIISIAALNPDKKDFSARHSLIACFAVLAVNFALLTLWRLSGAWCLLGLLAVLPFGFVQHWLNKYWAAVEPGDLLVRHGFNGWEMAAIVVGASLIGLIVAGSMIGVPLH